MMWNLQKKWVALLGAAGCVIVLFLWQTNNQEEKATVQLQSATVVKSEGKNKSKELETKEQKKEIIVDIKGAVQREGVYELREGSRVKDGIEKAGGFLPEADVTRVNLAQIMQDQMLLYIPKKGEQLHETTMPVQQSGKIPINQASKEQLENITGIGPRKAEAIIKYREEHGSFQKIEDLLEIDGIGEKSLEKMKDQIIVP
ncbi:helix-hairpin-helix domain-containing protein [Bacillus cytotoxicus]|uniref:helix-hairpin-helix domain-containing protein n=1 Tax=Bacillus cereus group sp. BfR-BA-01492 TaxID=2920361 RepID=UPI0024129CC2|nr:helix-hairpin-helix domain-containing protein [Bacillus cereus group sp. BfR-BA-01492]